MEDAKSSSTLREQGNDHYKRGEYATAIDYYQKAAEAAPEDPAPVSNLAAAFFESGQYTDSISSCNSALALAGNDQARREKLLVRASKCHIFLREYDQAERCLQGVSGEEAAVISKGLARRKTCSSDLDELQARRKLINEVSRYHAVLDESPEFFHVGHDEVASLFDDELARQKRDRVAILLAGAGDARHMFATIMDLAQREKTGKLRPAKYHLTVNDLKPAAIARLVVMLLLIDRYNTQKQSGAVDVAKQLLSTMFYTYVASIMPAECYEMLQNAIKAAHVALICTRDELPSWLYVPKVHREVVASVLQSWISEVPAMYSTGSIRRMSLGQHGQSPSAVDDDGSGEAAKIRSERPLHLRFGIVLPPRDLEKPRLKACLEAYKSVRSSTNCKAIEAYIDAEWKVNVTMIDISWERSVAKRDKMHQPYVGHDTLGNASQLQSFARRPAGNKDRLYDFVGAFFDEAADAIVSMSNRIKIEADCGEIAQTLERIRYGMMDLRDLDADPRHDTTVFPTQYDRIHLSNVPDYIGGTLASLIWAIPVLTPGTTSFVTSCNLLNPPSFDSFDSYNNEYARINTPADLEKVFGARLRDIERMPIMVTSGYIAFHRTSDEQSSLEGGRLPRHTLETWLYGMFLKLALPINGDPRKERGYQNRVETPLNMTMFFRILQHLHEMGYPAHWLAGILSAILMGSITTSACPPRSKPLSIAEVRRARVQKKQRVAPFVAEMSTLAAMWARVLPFGLPDTSPLPDERSIKKYSLTFKDVDLTRGNQAVNALVFLDARLMPAAPAGLELLHAIRTVLQDDERSSDIAQALALRERGLHVVSSIEWDAVQSSASFFLREDVMDRLRRPDAEWSAILYRTDEWVPQCTAEKAEDVEDLGVAWISK